MAQNEQKKTQEPTVNAAVPLSPLEEKMKGLEDYILTLEKRIEALEKKPSVGAVASMRDNTPIIL